MCQVAVLQTAQTTGCCGVRMFFSRSPPNAIVNMIDNMQKMSSVWLCYDIEINDLPKLHTGVNSISKLQLISPTQLSTHSWHYVTYACSKIYCSAPEVLGRALAISVELPCNAPPATTDKQHQLYYSSQSVITFWLVKQPYSQFITLSIIYEPGLAYRTHKS